MVELDLGRLRPSAGRDSAAGRELRAELDGGVGAGMRVGVARQQKAHPRVAGEAAGLTHRPGTR